MSTTRSRLGWLAVFGIAFGFVEAAVVVYLRALYYPGGFRFPLVPLPEETAAIEILREAATIVMLLAAAGLAARSAWGRFAAFAFAFGVWDVAFYLGLRLTLGWPGSLSTWDVLFLIPGVWTGPVWSAMGVAVLLICCGALILSADGDGWRPRPGAGAWAAAALSVTLLLTAFLWNHGPATRGEMPSWFPWPIWLGGVTVGLVTFVALFRERR